MKPVVLDSTAVIGFCDPRAALHEDAVAMIGLILRHGNRLVVPVSVLSEVLVGAYQIPSPRLGIPDGAHLVDWFLVNLVHDLYPVNDEVAQEAARYRIAHPGLPLHAALVFATAKVINAESVVTSESTWHQIRPEPFVVVLLSEDRNG
jgi:predicted nucleic acid-binding protein